MAKKETSSKVDPVKRYFTEAGEFHAAEARKHAAGSIENVNHGMLADAADAAAASIDGPSVKSKWHPPAVGNTRVSKVKPARTEAVDPNPETEPETDAGDE